MPQSSVLDALVGRNAPIQPVNTPQSPLVSMDLTAPEHKGLFGMKGNLRNIIGALGDALAGNHYYAGTKQGEREQDAMINFAGNPLSAVQAMANVNPDKAFAMQQQLSQQEEQRQVKEQRAMLARLQAEVLKDKGRSVLGSLAAAVSKSSDPNKNWKAALPQLRSVNERYDLGIDIPEEFDPDQAGMFTYSGLSPDQGIDNERADKNLSSTIDDRKVRQGIAQERLGISRSSAASAASNRSASLAERQRHNRETEATSRERLKTGKGSKAPAGIPHGLPPGFKLGKRIN